MFLLHNWFDKAIVWTLSANFTLYTIEEIGAHREIFDWIKPAKHSFSRVLFTTHFIYLPETSRNHHFCLRSEILWYLADEEWLIKANMSKLSPSGKNTLLNYFARSPATPKTDKKPQNLGASPLSSKANTPKTASKSLSSGNAQFTWYL